MTDEIPEDDNEFDDELELEPVDPDVIRHQQQRAQQRTRDAEDAVDINEAFEQAEVGDPVNLEQLKQFRFTTRHLLIATAVLAVVMTVITSLGGCMGLFVSGCTALAASWWFVLREERRRLEKIEADRQRFKERLAARRAVEDGQPLPSNSEEDHTAEFEQLNAQWEQENAAGPEFKFAFSMKELFVTFTVAAIFLGCVQLLGSAQSAALLLGLIALVGLIIQAFGIDLPAIVILGWWMLMVLYIIVSIWATLFPPVSAAA